MNQLFYIQLITSFVVGGAFIAFLTFIAEKVAPHRAGIILSLPSTAALGLFFLGWSLSAETVAKIVPATFIPLGLTVLFVAIYIYLAKLIEGYTKNKAFQIIICTIISLAAWFVLAVPIVFFEFNQFIFGIAGYVILIVITHLLLNQRKYDNPIVIKYTFTQKLGRVIFAGLVITLVVFLGTILGPFWGGIFAMFPTAYLSSMVILHRFYDHNKLFSAFHKIAIGSFTIIIYSITVMFLFPAVGIFIGTLIAYMTSLTTSFILSEVKLIRNLSSYKL